MLWWEILLIIIGVILFFVVIHYIIYFLAGKKYIELITRCDSKENSISKNMKVSYYDRGPLRKMNEEGHEYLKTLEIEEVYMTSFDGLKLHAYVLRKPGTKSNKYLLGIHGFRSAPFHEFAHYAKYYIDLGFNLVLPHQRGHYKSEGQYISMGMNEKVDVKDWCHFLVEKYGENIEILMHGLSMGGATVCMASNLDLPPQVIGIIADCGYYSYKVQSRFILKNMLKVDLKHLINFISKFIKKRTGVDLEAPTALDAVKETNVPIMFAHGEKDEIVPFDNVLKLYEACASRKTLLTNKEANHVETMARDPEKYFQTIVEFFNIK